ncbi:MAG: DUF222 domain-containing protein [Nitriliruptorales bacterium]
MRTAKRLGWLDDTRQALEAGEISPAHAEVIAAAAIPCRRGAIVDHEPTLVELGRNASPREVAVACRRIAEMVDPDGSQPSGPDERRGLYHSQTIDGLWDLRATLDPLTGERLHAMLNALATPDPAATSHEERRSPSQRRHDAFDDILRAAEEYDDLPSSQGARPHVLLTIDLMTLLGRDDFATAVQGWHRAASSTSSERLAYSSRPSSPRCSCWDRGGGWRWDAPTAPFPPGCDRSCS